MIDTDAIRCKVLELAMRGTVDNLNIDKVSSAIIPLPPLAEQKRIANRIEELLQYCQ